MPGDGHGEHLQNVGGGGIDEHSHKFQTHHNGQNVMQHGLHVGKIGRAGRDHMRQLQP